MTSRNMFLPIWMRYRGPADLPDLTTMAGPARQDGEDTIFWQGDKEFRVRPGEYVFRSVSGELVVCRDCRDCCLSFHNDRETCRKCSVKKGAAK